MTDRLKREKRDLRREMLRRRSSMEESERERRGAAAADRFLAIPEVGEAQSVLLFSSFGSEIPTWPLIERLLARGTGVLLPRLTAAGLEVARVASDADLGSPTALGPREPLGTASAPHEVDAAVLPGLAFDRKGTRLGYGKGHYDAFLPLLREDALRVGLGFGFQLVDHVPSGGSDQRVHLVVTDEEVVDCR